MFYGEYICVVSFNIQFNQQIFQSYGHDLIFSILKINSLLLKHFSIFGNCWSMFSSS